MIKSGSEFGHEHQGKQAIIVRALYSGKSAGRDLAPLERLYEESWVRIILVILMFGRGQLLTPMVMKSGSMSFHTLMTLL